MAIRSWLKRRVAVRSRSTRQRVPGTPRLARPLPRALSRLAPGLTSWGRTTAMVASLPVAYPLLRVEIEKIEVERVGGLPPSLLRPTSIEPLDLDIDGHLSSLWTAKAADLAKLTPQLAINALQQRGGAEDFPCYSL